MEAESCLFLANHLLRTLCVLWPWKIKEKDTVGCVFACKS